MALISLPEAAAHLRLDGTTDDVDLQAKVDEASAIILDYLKVASADSPPTWDEDTAPYHIKAATKLILAGLWDDREGDGDGDYLKDGGPVARLLARSRDPALA